MLPVPTGTEVDQKLLQTRCVVIQLAMNRSRPVSVALTLMAVLLTQRCSVLERFFCFWKVCRKTCECHPAHSFLFINMLGNYILLFHQSTMIITAYIAFDKYFYNCDVVVEISLYFTFPIHKNSLHSKSMHNET